MNIATAAGELTGIRVTLDRLLYQHLPPDQCHGRPHAFIYFLSLHNDSTVTVTIRGRKWVVTQEDGTQQVVEGDGVVGQHPVIRPGGKFSYNSFHAVATRNAVAEGAFLGIDCQRRPVVARIPAFQLQVPVVRGV
ncbi:MAG TPA: ApaG domain-containing protein [Verrucomicrobiota bacterium]|nr:ApaG domain [Verrucomicrobiales bacterium]HRI16249.1 ApaG domain-containing protein [Verrucomicrobiota bacterium]